MVQIIRPQMRNYQADQTDAIRQQQMTQNISEVAGVVQGVANIVGAFQKSSDQRTKEAEQADQDIIDIEMADTADYDLTVFNEQNIKAGVDVYSEKYNTLLEEEATKLFMPWHEKMTTEAGKNKVLERRRKSVDKLKKANLGSVGKLQKAAQAQKSAQNVAKTMQEEAFEFGKVGDFDAYSESIADKKQAYADYMESQGVSREVALAEVDLSAVQNYMLGQATTDPESILRLFQDQDAESIYKELKEKNPNATDEELRAMALDQRVMVDAEYKKLKKRFPKSDDKKLKSLARISLDRDMYENRDKMTKMLGDYTTLYKDSYLKGLDAQKQQLAEKQKQYAKGTPNYKGVQDKIDEIDGKISNIDEEVERGLRDMISKTILPVARESYKKQQAQQIKDAEKQTLQPYVSNLSPDIIERTNADIIIEQKPVQKLKDELDLLAGPNIFNKEFEELDSAAQKYKEKKAERLAKQTQFKTSFNATQGMVDGLKKVFAKDDRSDVAVYRDAYVFLGDEIGNTEMSDKDEENIQSVVYMGLRDRVFGEEIAQVLNNSETYYPDLSFIETYWSGENKDMSGVIMGNKDMHRADRDNVKNFINSEIQEVHKEALARMRNAYQLPKDKREAEMANIGNFIIESKKKIYGKALADYGINLKELQEAKNTKGFAYAKIGFRVVEFKGLLDNGTPIFDDVDTTAEAKELAERINQIKDSVNKKAQ